VVIGIVLLVLLILLIAGGIYMAGYAMRIQPQTLEAARKWQEDYYDLSWYDALDKTDYTVASDDGYVLHAQLLSNPVKTDRYVIISHGYTDNRFGALKYAAMYLDQGFHVIIYDLRGHGLNEPTFCTYSARERKDLLALVNDSRQRYPGMSLLGLHGESLGAATSIAVLGEKPQVDFVVADCGFSEIASVLRSQSESMHLPGFAVDIVSLFAKLRFGYSFSQMRPIDSLADNQVPILFIHGADDHFIPPEHSERMKETTRGYAELHLIPGAAHAMSVFTEPDTYKKLVEDFLNRYK